MVKQVALLCNFSSVLVETVSIRSLTRLGYALGASHTVTHHVNLIEPSTFRIRLNQRCFLDLWFLDFLFTSWSRFSLLFNWLCLFRSNLASWSRFGLRCWSWLVSCLLAGALPKLLFFSFNLGLKLSFAKLIFRLESLKLSLHFLFLYLLV